MRRTAHRFCILSLLFLLVFVIFFLFNPHVAMAAAAADDITILTPADGTIVIAETCPFEICTGKFPFQVRVTGAPMERVVLSFRHDTRPALGFDQPLCLTDPIEGESCPNPPNTFSRDIRILEGAWTVTAKVIRGATEEETAPIHLTVLAPNVVPPGAVTLSRVEPNRGATSIPLRDPGTGSPNGISSTPSQVTIFGTNLDNNPFLEVSIAPIPFNEPELTTESGLPVTDWCLFQAKIIDKGSNSNGESFLKVEIPEIPLQTSTTCGATPGPVGSIFAKNWRWIIRDKWIRPERKHQLWAIPSPRAGIPWQNAPAFKVAKPDYPLIDGFGFSNFATDPRYKEFLTVYGNNAYLCVGALGVCITRVPDPLYHILWWPIYWKSVGSTGGSCNGMAATSLLMSREELQPETFNADVHFPAGFTAGGDPATYKDTNFCTPVCSPPKPNNLWANIRMNHGVQISREFLFEIIDTLGEAIFNPNDITSIKGVPNATFDRVEADPQKYVLCFFKPGSGHCVTPYRVEGNKIMIYDNNAELDATRFIEIVDGDYNYPARTNEPNKGNAIMAFPIDIWQNERHLLGFGELVTLIKGDLVEFLYMIAVGSGDMIVTNDSGGRWGWEEDGSFTDAMLGTVSVPPLGPQDVASRAMPLLVAMNQPAPTVQINADGGTYAFHTAAGGHLMQLEANAAKDDQDQIQLGYAEGDLDSFDFTPQRDTSRLVPRIGLAIDEEESALFHWLGLTIPGGKSVGFGADKESRAVTYRNDTGDPTHHLLALDYGSGSGERFGRMIYGPFDIPDGASQRLLLSNWPDVDKAVSEVDFDRDGVPDQTDTVTGRPAPMPLGQSASADLAITQTVSPTSLLQGENVTYTITVTNAGPDSATGVTLIDALSANVTLSSVATTNGTCDSSNGLSCVLGDLAVNEMVTITYTATPAFSGALTSGGMVFGNEGDPDLTNNSAVSSAHVTHIVLLPLIAR